ncbi:MAG: S1C family serine protease [Gemmataceae bacterium]
MTFPGYKGLLTATSLLALAACAPGTSPWTQEAGSVIASAGFGNATMNNTQIQNGDKHYIVGLNDRPVESRQDLFDIMNDTRPEETISLKIKRKEKEDEKELTFKFKLIKNADMDRGAMQNAMGGGLSDRRGGFPKVIQHETVINPAQCGGPLVDLDGNVIGLNIARAGRVETWALPEDVITPVLKELKDGKYPLKSRVQIKSEKAPEKKVDEKKESTDKK